MSSHILDRRLFDSWAPLYDGSLLQPTIFGPTHAAVIGVAAEVGTPPNEVLDLGCGTGLLLGKAAKQWPDAHFTGIDVAPQMVTEARRHHAGDERFRFEAADAAKLPLESASVDLAFSTISFHHWTDQAGGLREVARVLRPGGLFVLADIRPLLLLRPIMGRFHTERARKRLFDQAGLNVVEQRRPLRLGRQVLVTVGRKQ